MKHFRLRIAAVSLGLYVFFGIEPKSSAEEGGWSLINQELQFKDSRGIAMKKLPLLQEEKIIAIHPERKFTEKSFLTITGGVSSDGKYAWVDRREAAWRFNGNEGSNLFQYYDRSGQVIWEKKTVVGSTISINGETILLFEVDPKWIATLEYGDGPATPNVYNSNGRNLLSLSECQSLRRIGRFSISGRYGAVDCNSKIGDEWFFLVFDVKRGIVRKVPYSPPGIMRISDEGIYSLVRVRDEYDAKARIYRARDELVVSKGKIE